MTSSKLAEMSTCNGAVQKYNELFNAIEYLREYPTPKVDVEIGTARGGTFWLWCQMAEIDAQIISIDLPSGDFGGGYSFEQQEYFSSFGKLQQSLHFIRSDSYLTKTELARTKILGENKIDLLFIDGDRGLDSVSDDYYRYSKYVNKDGLIIFHDIVEHPNVPHCNVKDLWESLKSKKIRKEFIDDEDDDRGGQWGEIGILINN